MNKRGIGRSFIALLALDGQNFCHGTSLNINVPGTTLLPGRNVGGYNEFWMKKKKWRHLSSN